jgi:hypothetical protein
MRKVTITGIILAILAFSMVMTSCITRKPAANTGSNKSGGVNQPGATSTITPTSPSGQESGMVITLGSQQFNLNEAFEDAALEKLGVDELAILRNSVYAKYGYIFSSKKYQDYFAQFTWYKPTNKNVESKLNKVDNGNIKKVQALEDAKKYTIKSVDNKASFYTYQSETIVFNYKNKQGTLYIDSEEVDADLETNNNPVRLKLKLQNSEFTFENLWNDGVFVNVADFDESDNYLDIPISVNGTDVSCTTTIYRYDGTKFSKYCEIEHLSEEIKYDGKGKLYFWNGLGDEAFDTCFDYKTQKESPITDKTLKQILNSSKSDTQ